MGLDGVELNLVNSIDEANDFMNWLGERRPVLAVDTETGGFEYWKRDLRLVQFGDAMTGWAIPWHRWGGLVVEAMKRYDGDFVMHNAKFDTQFLEHHGAGDVKIPWACLHDTMIMSRLLDSTVSAALKSLSARLVDSKAASMQQVLDVAMSANKWGWDTVPIDFEPYWAYAALDTVLTARIHEQLYPQIRASYREVYELEMEVLRVASRMEMNGCHIDVPFTEQKGAELAAYVDSASEWIVNTYKCGPGSNQQIIKVLESEGFEFTKLTDSGALSLDAEVLKSMRGHPLADTVLNRRRAQKIHSTYIKNFLTMHDDGFLRPRINTLEARTGRMSISEPALQTLPRDAEDNPFAILVRDCFKARPGNKLVASDFDQIELRVFADLSQDPALIEVVRSGIDPFTGMARQIYGDDTISKKDPRRQRSKNATYAKFYGAGIPKFSLTAGIPEEEGRAFMEQYDRTFPGVVQFQRLVERAVMERKAVEGVGYVLERCGRRHITDDSREYTAVNYLIQGTAGSIFKRKLVDLDLAGLGDFMVLPVHDEIVFDIPEELVPDASDTIRDTMCDQTTLSVPITAGVEVYDRWGDKYRG